MSDELATYFAEEKTTIVRHPDGHIIPTKGEPKAAILKFLDEQRAQISSDILLQNKSKISPGLNFVPDFAEYKRPKGLKSIILGT